MWGLWCLTSQRPANPMRWQLDLAPKGITTRQKTACLHLEFLWIYTSPLLTNMEDLQTPSSPWTRSLPQTHLIRRRGWVKQPICCSALALNVPDKFRVPSFSPADPLHKPIPVKPVELPVIKNLNETKPHRKSPELESPIEPESESSSSEPLPSPDSENIYESISDLNLDLPTLTEKAPAGLPNPQTNTSCSAPTIKVQF